MSHLTGENHVQAQNLSGDSGVTVLASLLHKRPNTADAAIAGIAHSHESDITENFPPYSTSGNNLVLITENSELHSALEGTCHRVRVASGSSENHLRRAEHAARELSWPESLKELSHMQHTGKLPYVKNVAKPHVLKLMNSEIAALVPMPFVL